MSTCDNTVLTGQEGLIQFKPLGTTNCVDDYCPFMGTRIYLPCSADYDVDDCIEIERVKIPSGEGVSDDGGAPPLSKLATPTTSSTTAKVLKATSMLAATTWRVCPTSKCRWCKAAQPLAGTSAKLANP